MNKEDIKYLESVNIENINKRKESGTDYFDMLQNNAQHLEAKMNMKKKGKL